MKTEVTHYLYGGYMKIVQWYCDICEAELNQPEEKILKVQDGDYLFERNHCHICQKCMESFFGEEYTHQKGAK